MAKLTGPEIIKQVEAGNITIEPFNPAQLNPNSYNIRLGNVLLWLDELTLDLHKRPREWRIDMNEQRLNDGSCGYLLCKGNVYLGHTVEVIGSDKYVPIIDGRSTIGRYGLGIHITAGFGDCGFLGAFTLELEARHRNTIVRPGDMIAQVSFETVEGEIQLYQGSYAGAMGPRGPKPLKGTP